MNADPIQPDPVPEDRDPYPTSDDPNPSPDHSHVTHHPDEKAGAMIGPYKLLQLMGKGGMGAVWMTEQTEPVQRRVALKIIKMEMLRAATEKEAARAKFFKTCSRKSSSEQ